MPFVPTEQEWPTPPVLPLEPRSQAGSAGQEASPLGRLRVGSLPQPASELSSSDDTGVVLVFEMS